jgi:hypothetical protein
MSNTNRKRGIVLLIGALFLMMPIVGATVVEAAPLQKVQMKVEGLRDEKPSFFSRIADFFSLKDFREKTSFEKVQSGLLSVPGVKKVEMKTPKKWLLFKDHQRTYLVVEFEQGTLTSETLILAVESASDQKHVYKAKFLE